MKTPDEVSKEINKILEDNNMSLQINHTIAVVSKEKPPAVEADGPTS